MLQLVHQFHLVAPEQRIILRVIYTSNSNPLGKFVTRQHRGAYVCPYFMFFCFIHSFKSRFCTYR